jgi:hypothetical protein
VRGASDERLNVARSSVIFNFTDIQMKASDRMCATQKSSQCCKNEAKYQPTPILRSFFPHDIRGEESKLSVQEMDTLVFSRCRTGMNYFPDITILV